MSKLSIVIPVKESNQKIVRTFLRENIDILEKNRTIVVDSGGGQILEQVAIYYRKVDCDFAEARKIGYGLSNTPFILNLDADTIVPPTFIEDAIRILEHNREVAVVVVDYDHCQGHYGFGISLWNSGYLRSLYKYTPNKETCECIYMWSKVLSIGKRIESLPYKATHLKGMK